MRAFGVSFLTSLLLMAGIAQADRLVVVELFTSQGCSSVSYTHLTLPTTSRV